MVLIALVSVVVGFWAPQSTAGERLPIFDTHAHYSRPAWEVYTPKQILKILEVAGVERALISSTPDDGTLELYRTDPRRIALNLRPYRTREDMSGWAKDQEVFNYISGRLKRGFYKGVGEFHIFDPADAASPQIKALIRLAVERGIVLQIHSDSSSVETLLSHNKKLKVIWAHAGMSEPPSVIRKMMDRYVCLWIGLSFRADDISRNGKLDPDWQSLFMRHPNRFLIGTDTYVAERWAFYGELVAEHRAWLAKLPRRVAEMIAYRNAVRLFGSGGVAGLSK